MTVRAYVDIRVADVAAAQVAAESAAQHWRLPPPMLLRHGMNAIFRSGDCVLRVATPSAPARVSIELAGTLHERGIPVPIAARDDVVECAGMSVTAWPFVEATGEPVDWRAVGRIVRLVHDVRAESLPVDLPVPSPTSFPWWDFESMIDMTAAHIDDAATAGLHAALERHTGWDEFGDVVTCHGDVHPGNVIMGAEGPVLIDWDLLCAAPAGWDHAPMMTWTDRWGGGPGLYEAFADGYGSSARGERFGEAFAELRLVAATLMRVRAGLANPDAMPEAERRLAYWRGDADAPVWRAQ